MPKPVLTALFASGELNELSGTLCFTEPIYRSASRSLGVDKGYRFVVIFKLTEVASDNGEREISDAGGYGELTAIGLWEIATKTASPDEPGKFDFTLKPAPPDAWQDSRYPLPRPTEGTALQVFDGPAHDYDDEVGVNRSIQSALDGDLIWELGFTGPGGVAAAGEGMDIAPATVDRILEHFPFGSALRLGLGIVSRGGAAGAQKLSLDPVNSPLDGAEVAFAFTGGNLGFYIRGAWYASGAAEVDIRPRQALPARVWLAPSHLAAGSAGTVSLTGAHLVPGAVVEANSIAIGGLSCSHQQATVTDDGNLSLQLDVPVLSEGRHSVQVLDHLEEETLAVVPAEFPREWEGFNKGLDGQTIYGIAADAPGKKMLVLVSDGLYRRTSRKDDFVKVEGNGLPGAPTFPWGHLVSNSLSQGPDDTVYAILDGIAYRSDDFGETWEPRPGVSPNWTRMTHSSGCVETLAGVVAHPTDADQVLAGTINAGGGGGLLQTTNGGAQWELLAGFGVCKARSDDRSATRHVSPRAVRMAMAGIERKSPRNDAEEKRQSCPCS
jgi:hypothetical protein